MDLRSFVQLTRQDREETARFGAAPIPGKIGVASGESRHFLGSQTAHSNPANRHLYIGNASHFFSFARRADQYSSRFKPLGRT